MKKIFLVFFTVLTVNDLKAQCKLDYSNYEIVLDENFNGYGGSVINLLGPNSIWNAQTDLGIYDGYGIYGGWGVEYFDKSQLSLISHPTAPGDYILRITAEPLSVPLSIPGRKYEGDPTELFYKSGLLTLKNTSITLTSPLALPSASPTRLPTGTVFDDISSCVKLDRDPRGWVYGMFEIRCKLPSGGDPEIWDTWPAFWLIGLDAELDIIDNIGATPNRHVNSGKIDWSKQPWEVKGSLDWTPAIYNPAYPEYSNDQNYHVGDQVSTQNPLWPVNWIANKDISRASAGRRVYSPKKNLEEFTTYTAVWTPDKITFFVDGIETYTINGDYADLGTGCPLNLLVDLQIHPSAWTESTGKRTYYMDIDYIRVYKPKQLDYTLPYKSSSEWVHEPFEENSVGDHISISPYPNSVATNTSNPDEIFYRGIDNYVYASNKIGGLWYTKKLEFNDGPPSLVAGDIKYLAGHDKIVYIGADNRINLFGRSTVEPCGFYHWYLRNDWWIGSYDMIPAESGTMEVTPDGNEIFFRGLADNKIHRYKWDGSLSIWVHSVLSHPLGHGSDCFVKNDILIDPYTYNILYKGMDNRLQTFWKDVSGGYNHTYIDNNWSTSSYKIKDLASSMAFASSLEGVLYIGLDDKIHLYKFVGGITGWDHEWLPYTYGSPTLGYTNADFAKGSVAWDDDSKKLFYGAYDGHVQCFYKEGSLWHHFWANDYWNKDDFNTFNSTHTSDYVASLKVGAEATDRYIYYTAYTNTPYTKLVSDVHDDRLVPSTLRPRLSRFKWNLCESPYNENDDPLKDIKRLFKQAILTKVDSINIDYSYTIYPNPTSTEFKLKSSANPHTQQLINIIDLTGKIVFQKSSLDSETDINVANLPSGLYIVEVNIGNRKYNYKLTKN